MHQVPINGTFYKLTQARTLSTLNRKLFGQTTAAAVFFLKSGENTLSMACFVADQEWGRVVYFERYGNWTKEFGRDSLDGPDGLLSMPMGIACNNALHMDGQARLFVADFGAGGIKEYKYDYQTGDVSFVKALWGLPAGSEPEIGCWEVAIHDSGTTDYILDDAVWAIDNHANRLVRYNPYWGNGDEGRGIQYSFGGPGAGVGQFDIMSDLVWGRNPLSSRGSNSQYLYVADDGNHRIVRLRLEHDALGQWLVWDTTLQLAEDDWPTALEVDGYGNLYVADHLKGTIKKYTGNFEYLGEAGSPGAANGQFMRISGLCSPNGERAADIFIAEDWSDSTGGDWYVNDVKLTPIVADFPTPYDATLSYFASDYHNQVLGVHHLISGQWQQVDTIDNGIKPPGGHTLLWTIPPQLRGFGYSYRFIVYAVTRYEDPSQSAAPWDNIHSMGNYPVSITEPLSVVPLDEGGCVHVGSIHEAYIRGTDVEHPSNLTYSWRVSGNPDAALSVEGSGIWLRSVSGLGLTDVLLKVFPTEKAYPLDEQHDPVTVRVTVADPGGSSEVRYKNYGVCATACECTVDPCSCPHHGDPDGDGVIVTVTDVVACVNEAFRSSAPNEDPTCLVGGGLRSRCDVNCSGAVEIVDVVKIVNVAFRGASPAAEYCSNPCP